MIFLLFFCLNLVNATTSIEYSGLKRTGNSNGTTQDVYINSNVQYGNNITELKGSYLYLKDGPNLITRTWNLEYTQVYLFKKYWGVIGEIGNSGNYDNIIDLQQTYGTGISHYVTKDTLNSKFKLLFVKNKYKSYTNQISRTYRLKLDYNLYKIIDRVKLGLNINYLTKFNSNKYNREVTPSITYKINKYIGIKQYITHSEYNEIINTSSTIYGFRFTLDF